MSTKVEISPKILLSISSLYNDTNRIFMEYIDNSIDSADQNYFVKEINGYSRPIEIVLKIEGKNAKDGKVTILDNCFGITNFTKIVGSIGDSDKKAQAWTNGQFGYGIYSFMAACDKLEVTSKLDSENALYLPIEKVEFEKARQEDIELPDPKVVKDFSSPSGTLIELTGFEKDMWKVIDVIFLKKEIERHFELILRRNNLVVKLVEADGAENICNPFNYDSIEGEVYENFMSDLVEFDLRRKSPKILHLPQAIHVYLKMTNGQTISKPPVFVSKGRRICEIKDVKSFKSKHKNDIWGHPNLTGFIDLHDFLGPTIARNDFANNQNSRALYQALYDLEDLIMDFVKQANTQSEERHYQQLEDVLNKALSKLARQDSMNYRTDYMPGGQTNLEYGGIGINIEKDQGDFVSGDGDEILNPDDEPVDNDGESDGLSDDQGDLPSDGDQGDQAKNKKDIEESQFSGEEKKRSGFNIRISEEEPQVNGLNGKPYRSIWDGNRIIIYKNHPDFQSRVIMSHQGSAKISERLISYLASEITIHYKDLFYKKMQDGQPEYNKEMFESLVDFIYDFEKMLQVYSGRNLSELS
jgi:hypothetical protein